MAVPWGLVVFLIGIVYGWLSPGRQRKGEIMKTGVLVGLVLALVLIVIGALAGASPLGLGVGALDLVLAFIVLTLLFIVGVWIGDLIEGAPKRA